MQNGGVECAGATTIWGLISPCLNDDFDLDEGETSVSANKNNFMPTNVNIASLKLVLDRLSDIQVNFVKEEQVVAATINNLN